MSWPHSNNNQSISDNRGKWYKTFYNCNRNKLVLATVNHLHPTPLSNICRQDCSPLRNSSIICNYFTRVANTLAYYDMPIITAVKSIIVQATKVPLNMTLMTKKSSATEFLSFKFFYRVLKYFFILMRRNQLAVSATRWQHGAQICFAAFK